MNKPHQALHSDLLTKTADYDEPGSWGRMSEGWPDIKGADAYNMHVFANCAPSVPYGSYVLMGQKDKHGAKESCLRVHADHLDQLRSDFKAAGTPTAGESVQRRGNAAKAMRWW